MTFRKPFAAASRVRRLRLSLVTAWLLVTVVGLFGAESPVGFADEKAPTTGESPLVSNSDWHYLEKNQNRVQAFVIDADRNIPWTMPATAFGAWKKSETEQSTGFAEHRVCLIQPLSK